MNTFEQNIGNVLSYYLQQNGFTATDNPLYYYKVLQGGVLTFVIEKTEDKNAEDEHQIFNAFFGLSNYSLALVKKNEYPPFMAGHTPETRSYIGELKNFNGMALEVKSNTDWERFGIRFTENLAFGLQTFEGVNTDNEILEYMALKDSHIPQIYNDEGVPEEYFFGYRLYEYLRMNKKHSVIEKYIRNCDAVTKRIAENKIDEAGIQLIIEKACRTSRQIQQDNFTPLQIPESFGKLCDWIDLNNFYTTISGLFEMNENGKGTLQHWITEKNIAERFGIFGSLPDGDMIGVWQQDNGRMPIVWIGNGGTSRVIAKDMDDFIALLAIGYYEFWGVDISLPPVWETEEQQKEFSNPAFQKFYVDTFGKPILADGKTILEGIPTCDDLYEWLKKNYAPWREW
jgi:hypothetical protein